MRGPCGNTFSANTTNVIRTIQAMFIYAGSSNHHTEECPAAAQAVEAVATSHFGRVLPAVVPMLPHKGRGRAAMAETEPLERRELVQPRNG